MVEPAPYNPKFDDLMRAIGRVAAMYSDVEFNISETIWMLMNVDRQVGACLTAQMIGPGPRFRALLSLLALRGAQPELIKAARAMRDRVTELAAKRNRAVHDPWGWDENGEFHRIHVTADHKLDFGFKVDTVENLTVLYGEIVRLRFALDDFRLRIEADLPKWHRDQFEKSAGVRSYLSENALDYTVEE